MIGETQELQRLELGELLAMRLCHDMAGLCGTLLGALDLAAEDGEMAPEALPLARETAGELATRLRLLRAAWGPPGEPLSAAAMQGLAAGLPGAQRLRLDFAALDPSCMLPPPASRLALNGLLLAAEALPLGGGIAVSGHAEALAIAIEGRRAAWAECLADLVRHPSAAAATALRGGSRGLLAPLLVMQAAACGARLSLGRETPAVLRIVSGPESA